MSLYRDIGVLLGLYKDLILEGCYPARIVFKVADKGARRAYVQIYEYGLGLRISEYCPDNENQTRNPKMQWEPRLYRDYVEIDSSVLQGLGL